MSLMKCTPCDNGACPYDAMYSPDCEYWCGADETERIHEDIPMDMTLTENELQTVIAVFDDCLQLGYPKLNKFMGSLTIMDMMELNGKIRHRKYCKRHNIKYEDMTAEDFERAYFEENGI